MKKTRSMRLQHYCNIIVIYTSCHLSRTRSSIQRESHSYDNNGPRFSNVRYFIIIINDKKKKITAPRTYRGVAE